MFDQANVENLQEGGQMERSSPYGKKPKKKAWREKIEQEEISKEQTEAADEAQGFEAPAETDQQAFSYGTYRPPGHDPALMEPEEVEQPKQWREELIITQDPFDTIRNTSHNVDSRIGQHFIEECRRARDLILQGATLGEISSIGQLPPKLKEDNEETQSPRRVRRVLGQQDVAEKEKHKEKSQHLDGKVHQQGLSKQSVASPDVVHQPKATLADL